MSNAERQARYRARHLTQPAPVATRTRRLIDRRSRPQRWRAAVDALLVLQADYADWLAALPDSLRDSATANALEAIVDLDLVSSPISSRPEATAVTKAATERRITAVFDGHEKRLTPKAPYKAHPNENVR